ncbi:MAG: YccF domain-containing protein [Chloroflexi bacterium]|nr:YccF domain-containing protein [Chloroflexota bacterium]
MEATPYSERPNIFVRALWFIFIGWWLGQIVLLVAWVANLLVLTLPLGLWLLNRLPQVFTLRPMAHDIEAFHTERGTVIVRRDVEQRGFWVRAVYFVLIGWWFSLLWLELAWVLGLTVIGLPMSFWMLGVSAAVTTLRRM